MCQPNVECNQSKQQQTFLCLKGYQNKRKAGKSYKCNQKRPLSYFKSWTNLKFQLRHYQWRKLIYNADQYLSLLSNDLLKAILKGSPSLLWQATDYGDETACQQPLRYLDNCEEMPLPTNDFSGTSIHEVVFSKGHSKIPQHALSKPALFPRCVA